MDRTGRPNAYDPTATNVVVPIVSPPSRRELISALGLLGGGLIAGCSADASFVQAPDTVDSMTTQALSGTFLPDGPAEWGVLYATEKTIVRDRVLTATTTPAVREFIRTTRTPTNSLLVVQTTHYPRSELTLTSIDSADNLVSVRLAASDGGFAASTPITLLVRFDAAALVAPVTLEVQIDRAWTTTLQTVTRTVPENRVVQFCIDDARTDESECQ